MTKDFNSYFNRESIIKLLCKYRLKEAKKKHAFQLIRDVSASEKALKNLKHPNNNCPEELSRLLPPRRQWIRPNRKERNLQIFKDSTRLYIYSISRKIKSTGNKVLAGKIDTPDWLQNLNSFIKKIQERVSSPGLYPIAAPTVKPIKKENTTSCKECRPISINTIEDRIVISLTAKYLTELFDDHFHLSSFAFRAVKQGSPAKSHHDTVIKIKEYLKRSEGKQIYVAECDIMKFFDCINQELTLNLLQQSAKKLNITLDENALKIFHQYLESYSFSRDVYTKNDTDYFTKHNIPGGKFKWKKDELLNKYYDVNTVGKNFENFHVGVPQGGAISCFISNLVMHEVDEVMTNKIDQDLLYMRFCDDMILLHSDKEKCNEYLEKYKEALEKLHLLVHEPKVIEIYDETFWGNEIKSKAPYKWGDKNIDPSNVPWVSFVGYQIRYDGAIRLRRASFEKEIHKQKEECKIIAQALLIRNKKGEGFRNINEISKKSLRQQLFALENRLISMSVGRILLYKLDEKQTLCWTNGFKALNDNKVVRRQLKILDSNRTRQLYNFKKKILHLTKSTTNEDEELAGKKILFGCPYSYYGFLNRLEHIAKTQV